MQTTRRSFLGGLAAASLPAGAIAASAAVPAAQTPQERFEYHLAEMKRAYAEMDPMVGDWQVSHAKSPDMLCGLVISAHRFTGRYEGDGLYLKGNAKTDAITYRVRLLADPIDGYRAFHVSRKGEPAMLLPEHSLNTFIGRRIA
jgi:hypothetical protein